MKSPWFFAALSLPLLGYLGSVGWAEASIRRAPLIELGIEGSDPRDLLRGHYLSYRLRRTGTNDSANYDAACVVPTTAGAGTVETYLRETARPGGCMHEVPLEFVEATHAFYVQQDRAPELERAILDGRGSVRAAIVSPRRIVVRALLVNGQPIDGTP